MKKIRKILPVSLYDIPGTERWLEQMANEGLFPAKLGNLGSRRAAFVPNGVPAPGSASSPAAGTTATTPTPTRSSGRCTGRPDGSTAHHAPSPHPHTKRSHRHEHHLEIHPRLLL